MLESLTDDPLLLLKALIFLAAATLVFAVMIAVRAREAVRRRAARINGEEADQGFGLQQTGLNAAQRIVDVDLIRPREPAHETARDRPRQPRVHDASDRAAQVILRDVAQVAVHA